LASDSTPVVHRGVALMLCENEAILEETMLAIDTSELHIERIGGRAIVAPAYQLDTIREALRARGMFPKVVGQVVTEEMLEAQDEQEQDDADPTNEDSDEQEGQ
jgi:hypothetical protein